MVLLTKQRNSNVEIDRTFVDGVVFAMLLPGTLGSLDVVIEHLEKMQLKFKSSARLRQRTSS